MTGANPVVTDADREAAIYLVEHGLRNAHSLEGVEFDDLTRCMRRHRTQATAEKDKLIAELVDGLTLARNRLQRLGLELDHNATARYEAYEWADEASALIAKAKKENTNEKA